MHANFRDQNLINFEINVLRSRLCQVELFVFFLFFLVDVIFKYYYLLLGRNLKLGFVSLGNDIFQSLGHYYQTQIQTGICYEACAIAVSLQLKCRCVVWVQS